MNERFDESKGNPIPIESADDKVLRMFGGVTFGPGANLILPSGRKLNGDEAQAFTAAFADNEKGSDASQEESQDISKMPTTSPVEIRYEDDPLSSRFDNWTSDPAVDSAILYARAMAAMDAIKYKKSDEEPSVQPASEVVRDTNSPMSRFLRRFFRRMTE